MLQKYSIGLDIGVTSVGWACMTSDFRIPKFNGRYAIGVREFEAAETAEQRRIQRGTRRRYNRRIKRIQLLQQTMSSLFKDDPNFFMETDEKEKHFWRNSNQFEHNSLSETLRYLGMNTRKYPTIYHLRSTLLTSKRKFHPRLIYLALHHLVKYRGHFLNQNMSWNRDKHATSSKELLESYFNELESHSYEMKKLAQEDWNTLVHILESDEYTDSDKRTQMLKIVGRSLRQPVSLLLGLKVNIAQLFNESDQVDLYKEEKLSLSFTNEDINEVYEKLTDEEKMIIDKAQSIYQNTLLKDLLVDAQTVAEAKVRVYEQFADDLTTLKKIYNKYFGEKAYRAMFITSRKKQTEYNQTQNPQVLCEFDQFLKVKKDNEDQFYRRLRTNLNKLLKSHSSLTENDVNEIKEVIHKLERNQFLQKQKGRMNAAIPHQNNVYEAETILKNQQRFYPEITDEMIEKVKQIISFRIPYYIGPLVKENGKEKFGWVSRIKEGNVKPWTIDEVIDQSQSAENFIQRMTNYCAYLTSEKVLPKNSLTYQKFELLNELNGIQIRTANDMPNKKYRLSKEEKKWLIDHVFTKYKSVSHQILKRELKKSPFKYVILDEETDGLKDIYGTQKEGRFGSSFSTYIDMERIFGDLSNVDFDMLEEMIYWLTVFEEKDIIEMKIKEKYPQIHAKQVDQLVRLNYSGWGRLSKRLLNELPVDQMNNQTLLEVMEQESVVFMEVLATEKYNLKERITKINRQDQTLSFTKIKYKDIKELQGSPAIKKGIWQAILIIEELVDIFGEPENIMIEFAREDGKKTRTKSRKEQISDLQKSVSREEKELKKFLKDHSNYDEAKYQDQRLYLYITQQGKCMYSGDSLNISRLQDYEVDHILPRSFVKDDSINNLALVKKQMNQAKGNEKMPLEILSNKDQMNQKAFWKKLHKNGLISQNKLFRLMKETFSEQDKESFFARQLVETRQITRHVKDLLNERFEHTEVHAVNANIISSLRQHSQTIKIRELNNKHHAVDAALAILIVQFIIHRYGKNFLNFNFKYQEVRKKWRHMLSKQRKNFFLFADLDQYDKFVHFQTGELLTGRQYLAMLNDEMPWQTTKKVGSGEAAFYKETLFSPKVKEAKYQSSKITKGVYDEMKTDSTYLISYIEKDIRGKQIIKSEFVDLYVIEKYQLRKSSDKELAMFLANKVAKGEVIDAKVHTKILKYQLIDYNGHLFYHISSREKHNAKQLVLDKQLLGRIYLIIVSNKKDKSIALEELRDIFSEIASAVTRNYKEFIPSSRIDKLKEYTNEIVDVESFMFGLNELLKTTRASAARSNLFGARFIKRLPASEVKFIHQSITGLKSRKSKSYKNELWAK